MAEDTASYFAIDLLTGVISPAAGLTGFQTRRAAATITYFKLNRTGLTEARQKVARYVRVAIKAYAQIPGTPTKEILLELMAVDKPFRFVVRQMFRNPEPALAADVTTALANADITAYARAQNWT